MRYLLIACFTNDDIPVKEFDSIDHAHCYADNCKRDFEVAAVINEIPPYIDEICDMMLRNVGDPISLALMHIGDNGKPCGYEILHTLDT